MLAAQQTVAVAPPAVPGPQQSLDAVTASIKRERRDSTTSDSSLEHLDLGRTPKKLNTHTSATSTPHPAAAAHNGNATITSAAAAAAAAATTTAAGAAAAIPTATATGAAAATATPRGKQSRQHDSDEPNDYDEDDSADEAALRHAASAAQRSQRHHKRRSSGRQDKRTSVQLEYNADNPNSLRKKFRFNRSGSSTTTTAAVAATNSAANESGFVDASSLYLNASAASGGGGGGGEAASATTVSHSATSSSGSAGSSPPHGVDGGNGGGGAVSASSPDSSGLSDDKKYVCPICEVVSASPHEFTNHIRCHNYSSGDTENFTCRICSKVLSSASSLDRHVLVHTGERPFNCKYCHLTFTTNGNMHRHMRTHKQHQHNHHHRRNSNGTKTNHGNVPSQSCALIQMPPAGATTAAATSAADAANLAAAGTHLTNGALHADESVKRAAPPASAEPVAPLAAAAAVVVAAVAAAGANVGGKRLNGGISGAGVESYESDGGCSTDSSSAMSQSSNNHHHHHHHHGSNNHNNNNNNNNNTTLANNNNNNNNINNNNNNNNLNNNLNKRKSAPSLDVDDVARTKRRVKTTINNNNIIIGESGDEHNDHQRQPPQQQQPQPQTSPEDDIGAPLDEKPARQALICPVCNASDFGDVLALDAHMDAEHATIPAKCRHCDVVFRTHGQLNGHPCTQAVRRPSVYHGGSDDAFPLIARSLCEQSMSTPCGDADDDIGSALIRIKQQRSISESSDDGHDDQCIHSDLDVQEQQRREEFLRRLYLNKSHAYKPSPPICDNDDDDDEEDDEDEEKYDDNGEQQHRHMMSSQQSHGHSDSKDLADIQSILNMTSSSSTSNFLKNFEQSVNTPSSNYSLDKDEEEAQDAFTSEFRKMKLRGEFPCKLCSAVFPNLRALKGHNRIHLSAVGPAGPFRCNMCPYSICDKAALIRHMRTHNGDRPYECAVCNYAFTTKANCERHLRNRHAKTTRDDVKRAIIYHPSEDSSCDDPSKRLHMFAGTDFDDDSDLAAYGAQPQPRDRSTPVSHLKEMLIGDSPSSSTSVAAAAAVAAVVAASKPHKIQVKSLEQLLDKSSGGGAASAYHESGGYDETHSNPNESLNENQNGRSQDTAPMDLSMDVLDLSKKPTARPAAKHVAPAQRSLTPSPSTAAAATAVSPATSNGVPPPLVLEESKFDLATLEKNQQLFLAQQQQLMNEAMPKIVDQAHYLQQLYRSLVFPPLNPFFLQNSFMPNNIGDLQKIAPFMSRMFGAAGAASSPMAPLDVVGKSLNGNAASPGGAAAAALLPQVSPLMSDKSSNASVHQRGSPSAAAAATGQLLSKAMASPTPSNASLNIPKHTHMPGALFPGGPVKMVIKNGVLMPKQKQRRYRTERPFACEHCSARFTLRSNMERHVKQQHPQFYAQRQRSGHVMRGRGANSAASMNSMSHLQAAFALAQNNSAGMGGSPISEQVKYAILAQQLKTRKDPSVLQQALAHGSSSVASNHHMLLPSHPSGLEQLQNGQHFAMRRQSLHNASSNNGLLEDDEPKLVIDEDEENDVEEIADDMDDDDAAVDDDEDDEFEQTTAPDGLEQLPMPVEEAKAKMPEVGNESAKKVADTILEQAIKASQKAANAIAKPEAPAPAANTMKSMIAQAESVGKFLKEVASSPFKDESQDLVPVSKLVDNATSNSVSFNNYFRPSDVANHMEQSDEEGLVASGSASESNNSGTEDIATSAEPKKKSAYSLAPNRVSCPYCQRMFPWSSSLRRHILTHTGQKPFKCSHCPLLFTTKSNCDRHLLRKHGNVESAVSVYVPAEDVNEPIPVPKSVEEIEQQQRQREEEERRRKAEEAQLERERREQEQRQQQQQQQEKEQRLLTQLAAAVNLHQLNASAAAVAAAGCSPKTEAISSAIASSELPYKCHLCESSFGERLQCLEHIKNTHAQDFALLMAKGAIDTDVEPHHAHSTEDEERRPGDESGSGRGGKYPDYSNRKVICAFCVRRFWSTEDLRRHMRTHSGERPFQCEICLRKFTLKHSMLRHMKKHNSRHPNGGAAGDYSTGGNSGSDFSDDEQTPTPRPTPTPTPPGSMATAVAVAGGNAPGRVPKIQELLTKTNDWHSSRLSSSSLVGGEQKENIGDEHHLQLHHNNQTDLIGNLLGISDQGILNKLLSSADEAAKLLGVEK